ncbi:MAG: hypothetical protein ACYTHK_17470 [Planctomycetota bacterium]|jgi:hypothetical protein
MRWVLFLLPAWIACAAPLPNGVYEVRASGAEPPAADAQSRVLVFDRQFIRGGDEIPPEYVLLDTTGYAPLDLAEPPEQAEVNGRAVLLLTLTPDAGRALTELTTHAERAAVVVGGEVVTVHRVRVPIEGGRLQVSC